jgi:hypothetical protein
MAPGVCSREALRVTIADHRAGTMRLATTGSGRRRSVERLELAEDRARRTALAMGRVRVELTTLGSKVRTNERRRGVRKGNALQNGRIADATN